MHNFYYIEKEDYIVEGEATVNYYTAANHKSVDVFKKLSSQEWICVDENGHILDEAVDKQLNLEREAYCKSKLEAEENKTINIGSDSEVSNKALFHTVYILTEEDKRKGFVEITDEWVEAIKGSQLLTTEER